MRDFDHVALTMIAVNPVTDGDLKWSDEMKILMTTDPWSSTLNTLSEFSRRAVMAPHNAFTKDGRSGKQVPRPGKQRTFEQLTVASYAHIEVHIVERLTTTTISVNWRDATLANYVEQIWWLVSARSAGICSLSGAQIARGQLVYKPRRNNNRAPLNENAMILSEVVIHPRDHASINAN
jgi:hypothetical protein